MEMNPYAPPQASIRPPALPSRVDAESLRREHINTEASIKSVGILYYLGAVLGIAVGASMLGSDDVGSAALLLSIGVVQLVAGFGLRRLRSWARIPTIIVSGIGLLGFPIGTLISAYILFNLLGKQGRYVMTPEYRQIIAATPHVKNKTSRAAWIVLLVLLAVLALALIWLGVSANSGG